MQPNTPTTPSEDVAKKLPAAKIMIALVALLFAGGGYYIYQSGKTENIMDATMNNIQTKHTAPGYLDKNDPIVLSMKDRAITDLKESIKRGDPESPENTAVASQMEGWSQEKRDQFVALFEKSINDYTAQTHFSDVDVGTFMLVFRDFGEMDKGTIAENHDIRVQYLGGETYGAEFWQDGLAVYSEKNVPDHERRDVAKERYAIVRKSIEEGKQERYTKMMALLYTVEKDGSITFHDPFQPMYDFMKLSAPSK